jgi:hypothetical protein
MTDSSIGGQNPTGFMAPLTRTQSPIQLPSYDPEDQGGNEGGNTGAGGAEGGNSGGTTQNASGGGQQPVAGATQGGGQFTYKEDRSDWVPRQAMAGVDSTVLSGLEKDVFEKGVSEGVNNKFPLKEFFESENHGRRLPRRRRTSVGASHRAERQPDVRA